MKHTIWIIATAVLLHANFAFADENPDVTQGAKSYDWQSCFESKKSDCVNNCVNSEDMDCAGNCDALARDKCQSEGLSAPQDISN